MCNTLTRSCDRLWLHVEKAPTGALLVVRARPTTPTIFIEPILSSILLRFSRVDALAGGCRVEVHCSCCAVSGVNNALPTHAHLTRFSTTSDAPFQCVAMVPYLCGG
jgi:hypothetical protein